MDASLLTLALVVAAPPAANPAPWYASDQGVFLHQRAGTGDSQIRLASGYSQPPSPAGSTVVTAQHGSPADCAHCGGHGYSGYVPSYRRLPRPWHGPFYVPPYDFRLAYDYPWHQNRCPPPWPSPVSRCGRFGPYTYEPFGVPTPYDQIEGEPVEAESLPPHEPAAMPQPPETQPLSRTSAREAPLRTVLKL